MSELEPIDPATALELYITDKRNESAKSTIRSHRSRLQFFIKWCEENEIENLNTLSGRDLREYRIWRRDEGDLSVVSEKTQMDTLRVFIRWLESIDGVAQDLHVKVQSPDLDPEDNVRDEMLDVEQAEEILNHLDTYEYASIRHVTIALLWHSMMRRSAVRAVDVDDYDADDQYIALRHRPETETPIKNGERGERLIALSNDICELIDDWLKQRRPDVTDDYGRAPLLATNYGRPHYSTIQQYVYQVSRPCLYRGCPHDRDPEECEARPRDSASKCPSSRSPHAMRRGAITHNLRKGVSKPVVSGRAGVGERVLEKHYDQRSDLERMEQRRENLKDFD